MESSIRFNGNNQPQIKEWFDKLETADHVQDLVISDDGALIINTSFHPFEVLESCWIVHGENGNIEVMTDEAFNSLEPKPQVVGE